MKFKADRATLLKALAHIQSVAEKRNTIPILANVMIAVRDGQADASPRPTWRSPIVEEVPASIAAQRRHHRPGRDAYEIVRKLPEGAEVELDHRRRRRAARAARRPLRHQPGRAAGRGFPVA